MAKHAEFTAPESVVSDQMPTSGAKYEAEMKRRTDATLPAIEAATDVKAIEAAMAGMTKVIGDDTKDNLTQRQVDARRGARRRLMRAALEVTDFTGKDAKRIFGVNGTNLSHIKRGIKRTATYDALGIHDDKRWSITDLEKKSDPEWDKHLKVLAVEAEVAAEGEESEGEESAPAAPKAKTAAQVVRAITAAMDALAGSADMDDVEAADVANALAALNTEAAAQGITA